MNARTSVLIVDDHRMFREGVRARLEREPDFPVVAEASSVEEALSVLEQHPISILILDIRMPGRSGIELARLVRRSWPEIKILILSGYDFDQYVKTLARIGIHGYVLKEAPQDSLVAALREILQGGVVLPPPIASKVMKSYGAAASGEKHHVFDLTIRELDILECLYQGLTNAAIAKQLEISSRTVETHVRSIIGKLDTHSRTEAVRVGLERGLIK